MENEVENEIGNFSSRLSDLDFELENLSRNYKKIAFKPRLIALFSTIFIMIDGVFLYLLNKYPRTVVSDELYHNSYWTLIYISFVLFIFGIGVFIYFYIKLLDLASEVKERTHRIRTRINEYNNRIDLLQSKNNSEVRTSPENPRSEESSSFGDLIIAQNTSIPVKDFISDKTTIVINDLLNDCSETRSRIIKEINSLNNRGVLNLVIGSATTITGIAILIGMLTSNEKFTSKDLVSSESIHYYMSRITTVIFIEVFSFFFLRLYRNSLSDIKYYQNELTNLEVKFLALKSSIYIDQVNLKIEVVQDMLKTDRNMLIKADQTNLVNSLLKLDNDRDKTFTDSFKNILDSMGDFMVKSYNTAKKPTPKKKASGKKDATEEK